MLYRIVFDSVFYYVEVEKPERGSAAPAAVAAWHKHVGGKWGDDYAGDEEPESIELVADTDVIR